MISGYAVAAAPISLQLRDLNSYPQLLNWQSARIASALSVFEPRDVGVFMYGRTA
jgi:hypothetical protein